KVKHGLSSSLPGERAQQPGSLRGLPGALRLQNSPPLETQVNPEGQTKQYSPDEVGTEHIACPVIPQIDARRANQHHKTCRDPEKQVAPPAPSRNQNPPRCSPPIVPGSTCGRHFLPGLLDNSAHLFGLRFLRHRLLSFIRRVRHPPLQLAQGSECRADFFAEE